MLASAVDPLAFAIIYLPHHLKALPTAPITLSPMHYEWVDLAKEIILKHQTIKKRRHSLIAPRDSGKSTWWFLIIPLWAAAFGLRKFVTAFADSATQAETHLTTFKHELDTNDLLRQDFPALCE